jgi:hypothetical protein
MTAVMSIEQLQNQVDDVNTDLISLKKETSDDIFETKSKALEIKVTNTKDAINKKIDDLKAKWEAENAVSISSLESMLVILETSTSELSTLKTNIANNAPTDDSDKDDDKDKDKDKNKKSRLGRNRWWLVWWAGVLRLGRKLFKKKEITPTTTPTTTPKTSTDQETSSGFWSKVRKAIKRGWLAVGWFFTMNRLFGKWWYKDILDRVGIRNRPDAPNVTVDDSANTITWLIDGMEYSTDGGKTYTVVDIANPPKFPWVQKVLVRTAKTDTSPESKTTELKFTKDTTSSTDDANNSSDNTIDNSTTSLTAEEFVKRNTAITDSINNATSFPVTIDYWSDATALEAKWCPKTIDFNKSTQSIMFGTVPLKVKVGSFETKRSFWKVTVDSVTVNSISYASDTFNLNVTGKGKIYGISKTDTQDVSLGKAEVLSLLQPYYLDKKTSYTITIKDGDNNSIPISIEKIGRNNDTDVNSNNIATTEYEKEFLKLDARKKIQYTSIAANTKIMYSDIYSSAGKDRLPMLLKEAWSDATVTNFGAQPWAIPYLVDKIFPTVNDFIDDTFFDKIKDKANIALDAVAEFLCKFKDNKYFWTVLGNIADWLKWLTRDNKEEIKKQLESDPEALKKAEILIKQISLIRFFVTEKKASLKIKYKDDSKTDAEINNAIEEEIDNVPVVWSSETADSLYNTLKDADLLDAKLSMETKVGVWLNAAAKEVQEEIENEDIWGVDLKSERGKIEYDYNKKIIKSWW